MTKDKRVMIITLKCLNGCHWEKEVERHIDPKNPPVCEICGKPMEEYSAEYKIYA